MSKKTITELKEYFKIGKRPTESQFTDLIDSYAHLDDPSIFSNNYKSKNFSVNFPHPQSDMAVDVLLGNDFVVGWIEVQVVGSFSFANSVGILRKQFLIGASPDNSIWYEPLSRVVEADGPIVNNIYIGNIVWDTTINQYKLTIYHTNPNGNPYEIRITQHAFESTRALNNARISNVYFNPLTGQSKHYVHYNENVGVGTKLPEAKLHVKETENLGNVNSVSALFDRNENTGGSTKIRLKYHASADLELNSGYSATGFEHGSYSDFNIINNGLSNTYGAINFVTSKMTRINIAGNGNVAIGANASNSTQPLTVRGRQGYNEGGPTDGKNSKGLLRLQSSDKGLGEVLDFGMNIGPSYGWIQPQNSDVANVFYDLSLNPKGGNVGIGVKEPEAKLDVHFPGEPKTIKFLDRINTPGTMNSMLRFTWYNDTADVGVVRSGSEGIEALALRINQKEIARFTPTGNAAFQGKLEAKEFVVSTTPTADHVFASDYNLKGLQDLEQFISEKKHLPEIPSAKEMTENGLEMGGFQIKLLQKIEELTLYIISLKKEIDSIKHN